MPDNLHVRATAEQYDAYTAEGIDPWDKLLTARLLAEKRTRARGGTLVDVGAGTAVFLVKLSGETAADDLELIATDYFDDMLDAARRRIADHGLESRIRVERQDVHAMSYPDGYARYIVSRSTIHHWADPVQALREIHRVLEPKGVALIHDVRRDAPAALIERLDGLRREAGIGPMLLDEKYTADEVKRMCDEAGIGHCARVFTSKSGPGTLGFELRITG